MIERQTTVYLVAAKPQAPPPPIQPPTKVDDSGNLIAVFGLGFILGMFFGIGIVLCNLPLPPGNPDPHVEGGAGPNLPTHVGPSR